MTPRDHLIGGVDLIGDVDPVTYAHRLTRAGDSGAGGAYIDQILPRLHGYDRARALIVRAIAVYNVGAAKAVPAAIDKAFEAVRSRPEPYLHGHLNALAALAAHRAGALDRAVTHLVTSARALAAVEVADEPMATGWHDLAMAYSYIGFHGYAASALQKATEVLRAAGLPEETLTTPSIRLRSALWHDHHGDTESCLLVLSDIAADLARQSQTGAIERVRPTARAAYGYTIARLRALGQPAEPDPGPLFACDGNAVRVRDLAALSEVCLAIGEGRPAAALTGLDSLSVSPETLGPGELPRLRALASLRAGDYLAAYEADRQAFRMASAYEGKLREAFVEGIAARLNHEDLRRRAARYAGEALTDALTGLPNRRHLEHYVASMVERGEHAVVGVCDMDGFKAVNTIHGHHAGDLVLRRVGEVINQVLRRGDFLARYGGDEFVVVLPKTSLDEAAEVAHRIVIAVRGADWSSLAPGTPVSVSVGWAEVAGPRMELREALREAFEAADRAMLQAKTGGHARLTA